ncbi:MAG: ferredoxin [Gammaproteobacteria bacterium]|nr:ferredoxin [Gammaproteobacteria bacterium]
MVVKRRHEMGAGGQCICPKCSKKSIHHDGIPCQDERCPDCGVKLFREGSYHHKLLLKKQQEK